MIDYTALKEAIRGRTDIATLVAEHVALRPQGERMLGLCPFHQEKTPSFSVSPSKQMFKCFGCGAGGDVFTFVQLRERVEFPEAMRILAEKAGIDYDRYTGGGSASGVGGGGYRADIARVNAWAVDLFARVLADASMGGGARDYVESRLISPAMIERFALGFAPADGSWILRQAREAGISESRLKAAGLVREGDRGDAYGVFRDRLMFPIRDTMNRVIGFGGRTLRGDKAKYLNTAQNALFDKGRNLYGLDLAREAMRLSRRCVVVEGYTDCIAAHQFGIEDTVATLGTALTQEQVLLLRRWCDELILVFDADAAGEKAADRALGVALRNNLSVRIAQVTSGKDPSDFLHAEGADAFAGVLNSAKDALGFKWNRTCAKFATASGSGRKEAVREFVDLVAQLAHFGQVDAIQRGLIVNQLAALLSLPGDEIHKLLRTTRVAPVSSSMSSAVSSATSSAMPPSVGDFPPSVQSGSDASGAWAGSGGEGLLDGEPVVGGGIVGNAAGVVESGGGSGSGGDADQAALLSILRVLVNDPGYYHEVESVFRPERFRHPHLRHIAAQVVTLCDVQGEYPLRTLLGRFEDPVLARLLTDLVYEGEQIGNFAATIADTRQRLEQLAELRPGRQAAHELRMATARATARADQTGTHLEQSGADLRSASVESAGVETEMDAEAERLRRIQEVLSRSHGFAPGVPVSTLLDRRDAQDDIE